MLLFLPVGFLAFAGAPGAPTAAPDVATAAHPLATHGDLIVGPSNSPFILSPTTTGSTTYYEQGNITVLPGGQLYVDYLTVDFVQFIANSGTAGQRASHIYNFTDEGLVVLASSTLTTDVGVLNPFSDLSLHVTNGGTFAATVSKLLFPGTILVNGTGSSLYVNGSVVSQNPAIPTLSEWPTLRADTSFSPTLVVQNGARASVLASQWNDYFAVNFQKWGQPMTPLNDTVPASLGAGQAHTFNAFALPSPVAPYLALALGNPVLGGVELAITYNALSDVSVSANTTLNFHGTWPIGATTLSVPVGNITYTKMIPLSAGIVNEMNTAGILDLLAASGSFGGPTTLSFHLGNVSVPVDILQTSLLLIPNYPWNMTVQGGSTLTVADSLLDLNWNATFGTPVSPGTPTPTQYGSQKLVLSGNSFAFLANVSVPTAFTTTFDNMSIALPLDAGSAANFYRWGVVRISSSTYGPIADAQVTTYSAYNGSQGANATVTFLNNFPSADPDLAGYLATWATNRGFAYGLSDATGTDPLLLASSVVTLSSLPTGSVVGAYHINTRLSPVDSNTSIWHYSSVTPYPVGLSPATWDTLWNASYAGYRALLTVSAYSVLVNGAPVTNSTVAIGENLSIKVNVTNEGAGALFAANASLSFQEPNHLPALPLGPVQNIGPLASLAQRTLNFTWRVNETTVGFGGTKTDTFLLTTTWNNGVAPIGGSQKTPISIVVQPAFITLSFSPPTGTIVPGTNYAGDGTLSYAGSGNALINVTLVGPGGTFFVGSGSDPAGPFHQEITAVQTLQAGGTYSLNISAEYNHRTVYHVYSNVVTVSGGAPAGKNFLLQTLLGLPIWLWLVIAGAIVAALLALLVLASRQARGKLVECGECGELIPEDALTCPKCGAEFEPDLVRCSRCGSTIPAKSAVCPECAATLLGAPGSEATDPERQGYADFVERFRAEAKKELQENYGEGAFWDWWKRQPSYVSFSQWKLQQSAGSRAGMGAPTVSVPEEEPAPAPAPAARRRPPSGGAGATAAAAVPAPAAPAPRPAPLRPAPAARPAPPPAPVTPPAETESSGGSAPPGGMRACANCSKEIPSDFLVCPFCGAVTR
ncbi:MAG: zinc ribbon domain-containing protein [Thermoplasmata archaeon]|nr:zinc ribbon domain-containing protein [Thermoplasmata archaeon]